MKARWIGPEAADALVADGTTAFRLGEGRAGWVEKFGATALISADRDDDFGHLFVAVDMPTYLSRLMRRGAEI